MTLLMPLVFPWVTTFFLLGFLESLDDFYLMDSQVALLQTTNNVFNMSLYELLTPESLLAWQRVRIANHMAHGGEEWYQTFKRENSGMLELIPRVFRWPLIS